LDATTVYWTNRSGKNVMRVAKDAAAPPQLVADALGEVWGIALDDTSVYWRDAGADDQGRVMRAGKDGSNPTQLATTVGEGPRFLAIDETNIYWTSGSNTEGAVMTSAKDGTNVTVLVSPQAGPRGIAVDDTDVYWTNYSGATIMKVGKTRAALQQQMQLTGRGGP
jgi:streptogramin lyase